MTDLIDRVHARYVEATTRNVSQELDVLDVFDVPSRTDDDIELPDREDNADELDIEIDGTAQTE